MLPGGFVGGDVRELTTYALVNGVRREVESFTSDRDLAGDLPEQVAAGGGVSGGSGTIVWAQLEDVQSREVSPWHKPAGWPPSSGDRVQVYVTDGVTDFPRFTGAIDKTSGTVGGGMQSTVIDDRDRLNATFSHEALLRHHVPFSGGGDYRSIGLSYWYVLTAALRKAGIYNTPPPVADVAVSVPLQGSVWPEAGTVTSAGGNGGTVHADFFAAPWGYAAASFTASYQPRTSAAMTDTVQMTVMVSEDHADNAYIYANYGSDYIRLRVFPNRVVYAQLNGTLVCQLGPGSVAGMTIVTLLVKDGVWTLRGDNGSSATGSQAVPTSAAMSSVSLSVTSGARIAGVQVGRPLTAGHEFASLMFTPGMRFTPGNLGSSMDMMPRLENRNVAELVDEICKATLTAAWFDESGVFQLVASDRLRNATPVQTLTTLDDITELGWEDSLLSVRSSVEVAWKDPSISKGRSQRKELFRGSGDSLESADNVEVWATPDDDTEWFGVDRGLTILTDANWGTYNSKRGSFAGAFFSNSAGDEVPTSGNPLTITTENVGSVALKINHVAGSFASGIEANLKTSPSALAMWPYLRDQNLPVIRGYGEGKWIDAVTASATLGPSYAPALTHELGYWGQEFFEGGSVAQRIADFIANMVTTPTPTLSDVGVLYDPRRQLGDVTTINSGILDVTIRALIVGISESHAPGDHSQNITVRIISVTSTRKITYAEFEAAWTGSNYAAFEAAWAGLTYAEFENEPLEGAPNQ